MTAAIITKTKPQNSNSVSLATEHKTTKEDTHVYNVSQLGFVILEINPLSGFANKRTKATC
jgi:hypothetical protein